MTINPVVRVIAKRWGRAAIAAALLWIDMRLFLVYAFLILLRSWEETNHLRAVVRVFQLTNDVRWLATARHLGVSQEQLDAVAADLVEHGCDADALAKEWSLAIGRTTTVDDLFSPSNRRTMLRRHTATDPDED